jgi:hypothetical protein
VDTLLIRRKPASQSLERGSSVTHNSLAATQRPNISLIDRRSRWPRRVPYRARVANHHAAPGAAGKTSPLDSMKPYQRVPITCARETAARSHVSVWIGWLADEYPTSVALATPRAVVLAQRQRTSRKRGDEAK